MSTVPRPLTFEVLVGCTFCECLPQHIRRGATFRMVRKDGSLFLAAMRILPDIQDSGIYTASEDGTEEGVRFLAVQELVELAAPVVDLGG